MEVVINGGFPARYYSVVITHGTEPEYLTGVVLVYTGSDVAGTFSPSGPAPALYCGHPGLIFIIICGLLYDHCDVIGQMQGRAGQVADITAFIQKVLYIGYPGVSHDAPLHDLFSRLLPRDILIGY